MRTSYLAIWCYALCFAHCKTFAEQSALARWRINSSPHFIWLYGLQSFTNWTAPRFHSPTARAFPSCHPERSEVELQSSVKQSADGIYDGKVRQAQNDTGQKNSTLRSECCNFDDKIIISSSFKNTVWYREYREYRRIKCCTKFAPRSHQHSTPIQLNKLKFTCGNIR